MTSPDDISSLREAVAAVKAFLDGTEVGTLPNDLIITGIDDHGDLWLFTWNNGWPLAGEPRFGYPGCDPVVVFKEDGRLLQVNKFYGWVEGAFDAALEEVRARWRDSRGSA
jgi:hypothetical protein